MNSTTHETTEPEKEAPAIGSLPAVEQGKKRVELRLDRKLYERINRLARKSGLMTNQLVAGILEGFLKLHDEKRVVLEPRSIVEVRHLVNCVTCHQYVSDVDQNHECEHCWQNRPGA